MTKDEHTDCYMLDTNIFSDLTKSCLSLDELPSDGVFRVTRIQLRELENTVNETLRAQLLMMFKNIIDGPDAMIRAAFAFDVAGAGFGDGVWRSDGRLGRAVHEELDGLWAMLPKKKRKRSKKENNGKDALIAEAAKFNNCVLLTRDCNLAKAARKYGIRVKFIEHLRIAGRSAK